MRLPIRTRLTLVFAGLSLIVLTVAGAALLIGFRAELDRAINQGLLARLEAAQADPVAEIAAIPLGEDAFAQLIREDGAVESTPTSRANRCCHPPRSRRSADGPSSIGGFGRSRIG
jgi:uncharacterized membrane protein